MSGEDRPSVEQLIEAITRKLNANKDVIGRSLEGGSIDWDWTRNGAFRVKLKPRI
jgi:hypothetical protein